MIFLDFCNEEGFIFKNAENIRPQISILAH